MPMALSPNQNSSVKGLINSRYFNNRNKIKLANKKYNGTL